MTAPRSTGEQALAALRVAAGAALDALSPAVPLQLAGFTPSDTSPAWWVDEQPTGGTSMQAECGPPSPTNVRDAKETVQFMVRGPRDVGYNAFRRIADAIEAALSDTALTLDDDVTPVIVPSVMIGGLRDVDEFGRQSMPVVVFYEYLAPRVVLPP